MSTISADKVKELRDISGAGMMDCKKALSESNGDIEKAIECLLDVLKSESRVLDKPSPKILVDELADSL